MTGAALAGKQPNKRVHEVHEGGGVFALCHIPKVVVAFVPTDLCPNTLMMLTENW